MNNPNQIRLTETLLSDLQGQRYDSPAKVLCLRNELAAAQRERDNYKFAAEEANQRMQAAELWNAILVIALFLLVLFAVLGVAYVLYWY